MVHENIVPPLFDAVLFDYQRNVPTAREPKVLSLLGIIVTHLGGLISDDVPRIMEAVFGCTLEMINKDLEVRFFRSSLYKLTIAGLPRAPHQLLPAAAVADH